MAQGEVFVGHNQFGVYLQPVAQAGAGGAGTVGAVEAEGAGFDFQQAGTALDAGELLREEEFVTALDGDLGYAAALAQGCFHRVGYAAGLHVVADDEAVHHQFDVVPFLLVEVEVAHLVQQVLGAVDADAGPASLAGVLEHFLVLALATADFGGQYLDTAVRGEMEDGVDDLLDGLTLDGLTALGAVGASSAGVEEAQIVVYLGDGADGGAGVVGCPFLVDGDGGREALDVLDVGLLHATKELAGVGGEGFDVAALALGVDGVEGKGAFAGAGDAGNHHQLVAGDGDIDILQVMLARPFDDDVLLGHGYAPLGRVGWGLF